MHSKQAAFSIELFVQSLNISINIEVNMVSTIFVCVYVCIREGAPCICMCVCACMHVEDVEDRCQPLVPFFP